MSSRGKLQEIVFVCRVCEVVLGDECDDGVCSMECREELAGREEQPNTALKRRSMARRVQRFVSDTGRSDGFSFAARLGRRRRDPWLQNANSSGVVCPLSTSRR
jgi:hypothetical protein